MSKMFAPLRRGKDHGTSHQSCGKFTVQFCCHMFFPWLIVVSGCAGLQQHHTWNSVTSNCDGSQSVCLSSSMKSCDIHTMCGSASSGTNGLSNSEMERSTRQMIVFCLCVLSPTPQSHTPTKYCLSVYNANLSDRLV